MKIVEVLQENKHAKMQSVINILKKYNDRLDMMGNGDREHRLNFINSVEDEMGLAGFRFATINRWGDNISRRKALRGSVAVLQHHYGLQPDGVIHIDLCEALISNPVSIQQLDSRVDSVIASSLGKYGVHKDYVAPIKLIENTAKGLNPNYWNSVLWGYDADNVKSPVGVGPFQIEPRTYKSVSKGPKVNFGAYTDIGNIELMTEAGVAYLKFIIEKDIPWRKNNSYRTHNPDKKEVTVGDVAMRHNSKHWKKASGLDLNAVPGQDKTAVAKNDTKSTAVPTPKPRPDTSNQTASNQSGMLDKIGSTISNMAKGYFGDN